MFLSLIQLFILSLYGTLLHPVHVSVTNMEFNQEKKCFEILIRVYKDDFQNCVSSGTNNKLHINDSLTSEQQFEPIHQYINNHLQISINKHKIKSFDFLNLRIDNELLWLYYTFHLNEPVKNIEISNTLMMDLYHDQTNLLIVTYLDKQKGITFTYNNKNSLFVLDNK